MKLYTDEDIAKVREILETLKQYPDAMASRFRLGGYATGANRVMERIRGLLKDEQGAPRPKIVGTIGVVGSGRTTLMSAIGPVLATQQAASLSHAKTEEVPQATNHAGSISPIESAWLAGYYHAGYTNDRAYAEQRAKEYASTPAQKGTE